MLDPYSHEAVAKHLEKVGEPLIKAFGDTPPYAIFSDSLEEFGADWTPKLPEEFKKRRGYDLNPHLPKLVTGGTPEADTVRHDYVKTLTELVDENYLKQIADWAAAHHTKFRSQTPTFGSVGLRLATSNSSTLGPSAAVAVALWTGVVWGNANFPAASDTPKMKEAADCLFPRTNAHWVSKRDQTE